MSIKTLSVKTTLLAATTLAAYAAGGCNDGSSSKDFFPADADTQPHKFCEAQADAGARKNATLHAFDFDGASLNGTGREQVDAIVSVLPEKGPVSIYLDLPKSSNLTHDRTESVRAYLVNSKLTSDQFTLVDGPNPDVKALAADGLARLSKTESTSADAKSDTDTSSIGSTGSSDSGSSGDSGGSK